MKIRSRVFASELTATERRIYGAVTVVFIGAFLATMWPVYPLFSRIRPLLLGVPFSLVYLIILVLISFFSLLTLYLWEDRRGKLK